MHLTTQKQVFGFSKGFIWWVKDSIYLEDDEILSNSSARFCIRWGWYFFDEPDILPSGYEVIKLPWEKVGNEDGSLKDIMLYPENTAGKIGERIELNVIVVAATAYDTRWNKTHTYDLVDDSGQRFQWTTAAKDWGVDTSHHIRGTIKDFDKGVCILTRCMER